MPVAVGERPMTRTLPPGALESELASRLDALNGRLMRSPSQQARRPRRARLVTALTVGALALFGTGALSVLALVNDQGVVDIQTDDKNACPIDTTEEGAIVQFVGQGNQTECGELGAAGSGAFDSFVRVQANGSEQGYNTDAKDVGLNFQFNEVGGSFTHSILVSDIPVVSEGGELYWELYADVNESNANNFPSPHISLNDFEVWFVTDCVNTGTPTDPCPITGYPFSVPNEKVYDFHGDILINDVNAGSGDADIRYLVPLADIDVPDDCGYKDPACEVFFVLYTQWGLTENQGGDATHDYPTDATFEEWKVRQYPFVTVTKTADTSFTRTWEWTIDKSVTPATWDLFTGDSGTSDYTIDLDKTGSTDSGWAVSGTITITNPGDLDAEVTDVADEITGVGAVTVECDEDLPVTLGPDDTLECDYSSALTDDSTRTNTATVTLEAGTVFIGDAEVNFGDADVTEVNASVNVSDTYNDGQFGPFTDDDQI
ncbi:MAG: hypothetical protein FIA92_03990, partial [Chloroflexi bacterium]|nr:hypothetical protein [Chloroflexota bacterium]